METHLGSSPVAWDSTLGCFVSDRHVALAAALNDYNPYFSLVFIPPKDRDATDTKPWAILDSSPAHPPYIMRYLSDAEMENTQEVLAWVFKGDMSKHRPVDVFDRIAAEERAEQILKLKEKADHLAEAEDFGKFMFSNRSPNYIRHNGKTIVK